jgi:carbon catabolite-derepressing protein kinase
MIAGHLPYQHKNTHSLYKLILNARYEVPKGMSRLAADLIATIFKTNPQKRARLAEIRNHPWMMLHLGDHKIAPLPPHQLLLNDRILQVLSRAGHKI